MRHAHPSDAGFTLMETIVAFVVFASVIVALERGTALGLRSIRLARIDEAALALARAKLAAVGLENPITEEGEESGVADGFTWRITARKYTPPDGITMPAGVDDYWVTVTTSWQDPPSAPARTIELMTLKRGKRP